MVTISQASTSEQSTLQATLEGIVNSATESYGTVGEMTYAVLHEAILTGVLSDGQLLRQESLAAALGVSRVPVRSALMQLEADGLVVVTPRRGARVRSLSSALVEQTFEIRRLLETYALRRSIANMTSERAGRLAALATKLDNPEEDDDFRDLLLRFYHELYHAETQPVLAAQIDRLRDNVGRQFVAQPMHTHDHQHRGLAFAVISGDEEAAVEKLDAHLASVQSAILAQMSSIGESHS